MKRFIQLSALTLVLASLGTSAFASMMNAATPSSGMSHSQVSLTCPKILLHSETEFRHDNDSPERRMCR